MTRRHASVSCALALAAAIAAAACSDDTTTTTPTTPTPNVTDTFTGTLTRNGATPHPFVAQTSGSVSAVLTQLTPDTTSQVGLALGTWSSASTCQLLVANDRATQGTIVLATVTGNSSLCVRIYDSTGTLPQTESYQIDVSHP